MRRNRRRTVAPEEECIAQGHKFVCQIGRGMDGHSGAVLDEHGVIRWRYGIRKNASARRLGNPFNKPDFVIAGADGKDEVVIRRASFIPPVFDIIEAGRVIGRVRMRSLFRNKYAIDIDGVNSWTFRMPLFTIRFFGDSSTGVEIWVAVGPSKKEWRSLSNATSGNGLFLLLWPSFMSSGGTTAEISISLIPAAVVFPQPARPTPNHSATVTRHFRSHLHPLGLPALLLRTYRRSEFTGHVSSHNRDQWRA